MAVVPRSWDGQTVVCVASGPSLCAEDVDAVRGLRVIAVNDAVRLAPWADVLYSSDPSWWRRFYKSGQTFGGLKYAIASTPKKGNLGLKWPDLTVLANTGEDGLERSPSGLKQYRNSGGAAINLAVHFGARRIVLLGYDMGRGRDGRLHFFEESKRCGSPYSDFRKLITTMVPTLREIGVTVINASRRTELKCFPCQPLVEALRVEVAA